MNRTADQNISDNEDSSIDWIGKKNENGDNPFVFARLHNKNDNSQGPPRAVTRSSITYNKDKN